MLMATATADILQAVILKYIFLKDKFHILTCILLWCIIADPTDY